MSKLTYQEYVNAVSDHDCHLSLDDGCPVCDDIQAYRDNYIKEKTAECKGEQQ